MPVFHLRHGIRTTDVNGTPRILHSFHRTRNGASVNEVALEWVQEVRLEGYPVYALTIENLNTTDDVVVVTDTNPFEVMIDRSWHHRRSGVASPASRARQSRNNALQRRRIRQGGQPMQQPIQQQLLPELHVVPFHQYTAPVIRGSIDVDDAYHTFFDLFCGESGRPENRGRIEQIREILIRAHQSQVISLTLTELHTIRRGSTEELCDWMHQKQKETCQVCRSDNQWDVEVFTLSEVHDIPLLFLHVHQNKYCFDIIYLYHHLQVSNLNPLTREAFTPNEVEHIRAKYRLISELMHVVLDMTQ